MKWQTYRALGFGLWMIFVLILYSIQVSGIMRTILVGGNRLLFNVIEFGQAALMISGVVILGIAGERKRQSSVNPLKS